MIRFPWQRDKMLDEQARLARGELAEAVIKNDRKRTRLTERLSERALEHPVSDMLNDMFLKIDEGRRSD